jgi:hypothetical protein
LLKEYIPVRIIQAANSPSENFPLLTGKDFQEPYLIYVCKHYACQKPVKNAGEIKSLLK